MMSQSYTSQGGMWLNVVYKANGFVNGYEKTVNPVVYENFTREFQNFQRLNGLASWRDPSKMELEVWVVNSFRLFDDNFDLSFEVASA